MSIKNYKGESHKDIKVKGRFDRMIESQWSPGTDVISEDNKNIVEFNINAMVEKPTERKKSFSYTLKPSLDDKMKRLAKEKGYSNKSSFMSALIEGLPEPRR